MTIFADADGYEFFIVSLDNKQWHFEAASCEERDEWVSAIEQQILNSLQLNESSKTNKQTNSMEAASIQSIRSRVAGNSFCVDCDATSKFSAAREFLNLIIFIYLSLQILIGQA